MWHRHSCLCSDRVRMRISFLVAVATNGVIGRDGKLPWHLSGDLKRLKALSMGHHVVMGRKTFDEIGRKPLPGRTNVIISRAEIFRQTMHRATRMYITQVHADVRGDTYFPEFDDVNEWKLVDREDFESDARNDYAYSFLTYDRVAA